MPDEGVDLSQLPPEVAEAIQNAEQQAEEGTGEVPSVMSVTTRFLVGRVGVTEPAEDGSRVIRLFSGNGGTIIEANLSPQLCEYTGKALLEVEVITAEDAAAEEPSEDGEEAPDAGDGEN